MTRGLRRGLLAGALLVVLVAGRLGGAGGVVRAVVSLALGYLVLRIGTATLLPLRAGEKLYDEPVDVIEPDGVPVYSCAQCGTQLVLLRRGSDRPPRHCGEAMTFRVVPEFEVPAYPPDDPA